MAESDMRGVVVRAMRKYDAMAVENRVRPGTPDVNYIGGWVELKWIKFWPKNAEVSPVHVDHFTPQQRIWLKTRWRRGGRSFLLLQAGGKDWLLFDGETAAHCVGRATRGELFARALKTWNVLNKEELSLWLTMDLPALHQRKLSLLPVGELASHSDSSPKS